MTLRNGLSTLEGVMPKVCRKVRLKWEESTNAPSSAASVRRGDTANNGEIVVALVEGEEATLKRLRRKGASIALEPANRLYETRIFGPDQVQVQGRLVGLMRRYH